MPMNTSDISEQDVSRAVALATLAKTVEHLEAQIETQQKELDSLKKDRDSALRWGIVILGTSVISMGTWIFKLLVGKIPSL